MKNIKLDVSKIVIGFFLIILIVYIYKFYLVVPNNISNDAFLNSYKYIYSDSYDWLGNGIRFLHEGTSFRNPGLPIVIKILYSFNVLFLLPLVNGLALWFLQFFVYKITHLLTKNKWISLLPVLFLFFNYGLQLFVNIIMADIYAAMFIAGALYFALIKDHYKALVMLMFSMLFQNVAYFVLPIFGILYLYDKDLLTKETKVWRKKLPIELPKLIAIFSPIIIWHLYKFIKFGNPLHSEINQFSLLKFDTQMLFSYTINSILVFGFLIFFILLYFFFRPNIIKEKSVALLSTVGLIIGVFWVFMYDWNDKRFLYYLIGMVYPLAFYFVSKFQKEDIYKLVVILAIGFIPSFGYLKNAVTNNIIPIALGYELEFESFAHKSGKIESKFPVVLNRNKFNNLGLYLFPWFFNLERQNEDLKTGDNTFGRYSEYIELNFNEDSGVICIDETIRRYWFNPIMLIETNYFPPDLVIDESNCKLP